MELKFEIEKMNDVFTKHHIKGLPFDAVIHHFSEKDNNDHIHDHPFAFTTHVLHGFYTERVYYKYSHGWEYRDFDRQAGEVHYVHADCIHEIIDVSEGGCFTVMIPEEKTQEVSFYKFENKEIIKI